MRRKCERCDGIDHESTTQYSVRTRYSFDEPFLCFFCRRLKRAIEDPEGARLLQEKIEQRKKISEARKREKEKIKEFIQQVKNCPGFQAYGAEFRKEIQKKSRALNGLRAKRFKMAMIALEENEKKRIKEFYANTPEGYHVDHIIPISKGGKHFINNLQYLPAKENCSKNDKIHKTILERFSEGESISIPWLMRYFKLSFEDAENVLRMI